MTQCWFLLDQFVHLVNTVKYRTAGEGGVVREREGGRKRERERKREEQSEMWTQMRIKTSKRKKTAVVWEAHRINPHRRELRKSQLQYLVLSCNISVTPNSSWSQTQYCIICQQSFETTLSFPNPPEAPYLSPVHFKASFSPQGSNAPSPFTATFFLRFSLIHLIIVLSSWWLFCARVIYFRHHTVALEVRV